MGGVIAEPFGGRAVPPDAGGKARGLAAIDSAGLATPPWFVVLPTAFEPDGSLPPDARADILAACERIAPDGGTFAVRSSALDEDSAGQSFAGQYRTELEVTVGTRLLDAVARCAAPGRSTGLGGYRRATGQADRGRLAAVVVQRYVPSRVSGVAFGREPLQGADEVVIAAARQPAAVTSGDTAGEEYRVGRDGRVTVAPGSPNGPRGDRLLSDAQARAVARAAWRLEQARGTAQDIEWLFSVSDELVVVQSRPITGLPADAEPDADVRVWDNANIVESFPDLTLPLTFSVARGLYARVYRSACLALGVPQRTVEREAALFDEMLGLIGGQVYYNLASWYRVLALLPGFRLTSGFLESMMGADRPGSRSHERAAPVVPPVTHWTEIATMTIRLTWRLLRLGADAERFRTSIHRLLGVHRNTPSPDADSRELLATFERVSDEAVRDWAVPIVNDLFLMLSHGALRRVADRWLGDASQRTVNALLATGSVPSARPAWELAALATTIRENPVWRATVTATPPAQLLAVVDSRTDLAPLGARIERYLETWGDRAPRELQLDRPSYRDDPVPLLASLQSVVKEPSAVHQHVPDDVSEQARRHLGRGASGRLRSAALTGLVRMTLRHIGMREEMRLARGRVFGVGRRIVRQLGLDLAGLGLLAQPDDVHYLTLEELRRLVFGETAAAEAGELVQRRRAEYEHLARQPRLPSRFETRGPVREPVPIPGAAPLVTAPDATGGMRGIGAANGRASGPCVVLHDPSEAGGVAGRIVVVRAIDPGWVPMLVGAAGLLVEHGGLLSHSAIVARELRIPTVVGVQGLLDRVRSGDVLALDGSTGEVVRIIAREGGA